VTSAVGFDLDMTLIDSRPGIATALRALSAETGVFIDVDLATSRLGPPLVQELAHWFPADEVEAVAEHYRGMYPAYAIEPTLPLPGAVEALQAVHDLGLRTVVVTSKVGRNAKLHLDHLGMPVDDLAGDLFAEGKASAIQEYGVGLYVGDHVGDMIAARTAGVPGVGVTTGPCGADELLSAGATHVLSDLTGFPELLRLIAVGSGD
jgi:phosphoglycolate phosphatase